MKEAEENPLVKLIESENFNKEEMKEKILEAFILKSENSYSLFEKILTKYGDTLKGLYTTPSELINSLIFYFGHNEVKCRHYFEYFLDKDFFSPNDVFETLIQHENALDSFTEIFKTIFV